MQSLRTRRLALPFLAVSLAGCSDSTGLGNLTDMVLDFCSGNETPVFIAFQNEGQSWTRLTADGNGTITFRPTNKVGLTFVYQFGQTFFTDIVYTTRTELDPLANAACAEQAGTKSLNGSVASVTGAATADVTMGPDYVQVVPPPSTFTLDGLPSDPLDLLASRRDFIVGVYAPNRVIVRRGVNLTSGATIPALDFAAAEALPPTQSTAAIAGLTGSDNTSLFVDFSTATTPLHPLHELVNFSGTSQTLYGVPSSLTQQGDVHILTVRAFSSTGNSYRVHEQYYRNPADRNVALGAALNAPTVTTLSSTPYLRLSTSLPSQAEYGSFANVTHSQGSTKIVSVTGTAAYFGTTPSTWVLDIPELSGVTGFSSVNFGLQSGGNTQSYVEAYDGLLATFFGGLADGASLKFAGRLAGVGLIQMWRTAEARPERRSRFSVRRATLGGK